MQLLPDTTIPAHTSAETCAEELLDAPAANLSAVADILNSSLPTASRVVSGLVAKGLIDRSESATDRRQVELVLTSRGRSLVETARRAARGKLAAALAELSEADRSSLADAPATLRGLF